MTGPATLRQRILQCKTAANSRLDRPHYSLQYEVVFPETYGMRARSRPPRALLPTGHGSACAMQQSSIRYRGRCICAVTRSALTEGNDMAVFPTSTTVLDSILFRDAFGTPQMREVFSDFSLVSRYAEVEVALAKAEARCGVIPAEAAVEIAARTDVSKLDFDLLRRETDVVGYPILPLVHQMVKQCGEAGRYVHWGATTQDIMDTAVVLQIRAGLEIISQDIAALRTILNNLSRRYRDT